MFTSGFLGMGWMGIIVALVIVCAGIWGLRQLDIILSRSPQDQ